MMPIVLCPCHHEPRAVRDDHELLDVNDALRDRVEQQLQPLLLAHRLQLLRERVHPQAAARGLRRQQLDRMRGADVLDEERVGLGAAREDLRHRILQLRLDREPRQREQHHPRQADAGEHRAVVQHQHEGDHAREHVEQPADQPVDEEPPDFRHRRHARDRIARVVEQVIADRQPREMADHVRGQLLRHDVAQVALDVADEVRVQRVEQEHDAEQDRQQVQDVDVGLLQRLVDRQLHVRRPEQQQQLRGDAARDAEQDALADAREAHQIVAQANLVRRADVLEADVRIELERVARDLRERLRERQLRLAERRIDDVHAAVADLRQHDIVVHPPVQDAGQFQRVDLVRLELEPARAHAEVVRDLHQIEERQAGVDLDRIPVAQRAQRRVPAVPGRDHRKARETAFGHLVLKNGPDFICIEPHSLRIAGHDDAGPRASRSGPRPSRERGVNARPARGGTRRETMRETGVSCRSRAPS